VMGPMAMLGGGGANANAMRAANMPKIPEGLKLRVEAGGDAPKDGKALAPEDVEGSVSDLATVAPERVYRVEIISEVGAVRKRLTAVYDMQFSRAQSKGMGAWIYYRED
jgi:hypothetical protein